jgi:hypothetical protein
MTPERRLAPFKSWLSNRRPARPVSGILPCACFLAGAAALGHALQVNNGFYDPVALAWMTIALGLAVSGALAWSVPVPAWRGYEVVLTLGAGAIVAWQVSALLEATPGFLLTYRRLEGFYQRIGIEAAIIGVGFVAALVPTAGRASIRYVARLWFPALLAVHLSAGTWMIQNAFNPQIDVVLFHNEAFKALANGQNPYDMTIRNIYGADSGFYDKALVRGDRVLIGYPYPPLSLLLAAPAYFLKGDYRYAQLIAWIAAAALVAYAGAGLLPKLAGAVLLTEPRGFFVLEQGWTEPIALFMLTLTAFVLARRPALSPWIGGLLLVTKQYLALALPALWRWARATIGVPRFLLKAALIGAAVTLPFLLWHGQSFLDNVVFMQARQPFRLDSLSFLAFAARQHWGQGSLFWAVGASVLALAVCMRVTPNTAAGFAATMAVTTFAMFAFGSMAFCNYYFFVAGACCCAAAHASVVARRDAAAHA